MRLDPSTMMRIPVKIIRLGLYCLLFLSVTEVLVYISGLKSGHTKVTYKPTWDSLDSRPIPEWYDEAKFGVFIHWGVYSVPSFGSEWFWWNWQNDHSLSYESFMRANFRPGFTYTDFAPDFRAEFFDPKHWANVIAASGAKYVVLTSKHHEGYTMWPSKFSWNWNAKDIGSGRDLLGDLAKAIKKTHMRFGLYFSLYEWFNPLYLVDKKNNFKTTQFVDLVMTPQLSEIVNNYHPEVIWADGSWDAPSTYWNSTHFLAWLYNDSPVKDTVVTNDRWGSDARCLHGGFLTCADRFNPGKVVHHKWENCMTIDKLSWGYRRDATLNDYFTMEELIRTLVETVSFGGNLLMNIGPTHDGRIAPIFEERLRDMGKWLSVNGEAIFSTRPWDPQNDTASEQVWYTSKQATSHTNVYAVILKWPKKNTLPLDGVSFKDVKGIQMLGHSGTIQWSKREPKGEVVHHKWENCMTIDKLSWGYRRDATLDDYFTTDELIRNLVETVSFGGNLLMNIGPTHDVRIAPIFEERLRDLGKWLSVNGEAIFSTRPWDPQNDTASEHVWYTSKQATSHTNVYAVILKWPKKNTLPLDGVSFKDVKSIQMLGHSGTIQWSKREPKGITVEMPLFSPADVPCQWAWVLKIKVPQRY